MINRQLTKFLAFSVLLISSMTVCQQAKTSVINQTSSFNTKQIDNSNVKGKSVSSENGKITVTVPNSWKLQEDLNDQAELQLGDRTQVNYLIIISDPKIDFDNMTLEQHSYLTRTSFLEKITNARITENPKKFTINGQPALQYKIEGSVNGINIVYLHTTVQGDEYFHQILAWTVPSKFPENKPILESVINSFQEN